MKKSLIIKISIIITVALLIFSLVAGIVTAENDTEIMERELIRLTNMYAEYASITSPDAVAKISDKDADVRVSVIAMDGTVVAESLKDVTTENHLYREEVQNAINGIKNKVVIRNSSTARVKLAYYAVKTDVGGEEMIVRVAVPAVNIDGFVTATVVMFVIMIIVITALTAVLVTRTVNGSLRPLAVIKKSLDDIKNGEFKAVMPNERHAEINDLINGINDVADNLSQTLNELGAERKKLRYVTENLSEAVIALDGEGKVIMSNAIADKLFGAAEGSHIDLLLCNKELERVYCQSDDDSVSSCVFEKDDKYYRFMVSRTPEDGEEIAKIVIVTDITKTKLAEKERREFFSNCSHELKTPLAVIKGYAELISNNMVKDGDKLIDYSKRIVSDSDKLLGIIEDMLILSRLDENITGNPQIIDVKAAVEEIVAELKEVDKYGVEVTIKGADFNILMAHKNADGLLRNIIENAFKYNRADGSIKVVTAFDDGKYTLTVKDSGEGIPKEDLQRVTERFYRVEKSRSVTKGSGLGLAIVKHICSIYGITMTIDSELGKGTAVTLIFPDNIVC